MSYKHINHVRDHSLTRGPARLLLLTIATRTDDEGYAYPSLPCLAKDTGMTIRSVRRALTQIPENEIAITPGGSEKGQRRRAALYRVKIDSNNPAPNAHSQALDRAPNAQGNNHDHAPINIRPCAVGYTTVRVQAHDPARNAHLTVIESSKNAVVGTEGSDRDSSINSIVSRFENLNDSEFIESLKNCPELEGISISKEKKNHDRYRRDRNLTAGSRKTFVSWLLNCDKPLSDAKSSVSIKTSEPLPPDETPLSNEKWEELRKQMSNVKESLTAQ